MTFARTKIQPPRPRPGSLIERPQLEARLGAALLTCRLVLLCAAAGFGKTSLLARAVERLPTGTALAWLACDEGDSPARLFECLLAALEPFDLPWRTAPEALARVAAEAATPGQRRRIAAELINALDACDVPHGVIVVEDLHRAPHPAVHDFLDALLERFTPRWTLAITSRAEPPLALARLRAADELAEFRLHDLRFDAAEARALGSALGLTAEAADRLAQRAEGWPAGLRLAFNAQRGAPSAWTQGSQAIDRALFDFIAAEVIDRLRPALRDFLLSTSVLPELSAARCAALSGDARAADRLDEIERAGLFSTRLEAAEPTLRLHDLFRDALGARLLREQPERLAALLRRAAASESDPQRRIAWLLRAEDWDGAEAALAASAETLITQGQAQAVRTLLERFSAARVEASPTLLLVRAILAWTRWDWAMVIDATARAAQIYALRGDAAGERSARSYHCVALAGAKHEGARPAIDALLAEPALEPEAQARALAAAIWVALRGDQRQVAPLMVRMLEALEPQPSLARWYECCPLPPMAGLPGMREPLQRYIAGATLRMPDHPTPLRGMCQVIQGWLHLFAGEIERAEACAEAAAADARWLARPVNVDSYSRSLLAVLTALRGRREDALAAIEGLVQEVETSADPMRIQVYLGFYVFMAMRVAALLDDRPALLRLAQRLAAEPPTSHSWLSAPQRAAAPAHIAALHGDLAEASRLWRELLAREHWSDRYGQVAEARLRLADTLLARGRPQAEAVTVLQPLFEDAARGGDWGAVLMGGPALLTRLAAADWGGALPAAQWRELARWAAHAAGLLDATPARSTGPARGNTTPAAAAGPGGDLSARELEVLAHIAAGDSNKLIARALDLSPHTVKRHVANILDKLALASRGQAAAWYRDRR